MSGTSNLRFILHVSDFHIGDDPKEARAALMSLTQTLKANKFKVDYLVHTGDVIDSGDLYNRVATDLVVGERFWGDEVDEESGETRKKFLHKKYQETARKNEKNNKANGRRRRPDIDDLEVFDKKVTEHMRRRFNIAKEVIRDFVNDLNVAFGNVVICSGNHDVLRPLSADESDVTCRKDDVGNWRYTPSAKAGMVTEAFRCFLKELGTANSTGRCKDNPDCAGEGSPGCADCAGTAFCAMDDLNVLVLNTNWANPVKQKPGYYCVNCVQTLKTIQQHCDESEEPGKLNVIIAHKPIYEICEKARLPFKRYTKTPFFSEIQRFLGKEGIYLCGDKHTRSIVASLFHDIPHYIGGEPIRANEGQTSEVEYNLLAISDGQVDMKRKLHLSINGREWNCEVRPQDQTVKDLYRISWKYISKNSFESLSGTADFSTWESLCQVVYNWTDEERRGWYAGIDQLYGPICRYRINGEPDSKIGLPKEGIFPFIQKRIIEQMRNCASKNVLNLRGEHSAGKSMFLGQFYIHLMTEYSRGSINFIPAYFNLDNEVTYQKIESGDTYYKAVQENFKAFVNEVQEHAKKEHQPVCYLIDGLDELDCWSYSTEDSVGRELLNRLAEYDDAWYAMAFSQHNLPGFKNTMPLRKYNDISDIMYFNPMDVNEESTGLQFTSFITAYLQYKRFPPHTSDDRMTEEGTESDELKKSALYMDVCKLVRSFRRLTINPGFLFQNNDYLTDINREDGSLLHRDENVSDLYNYYIDRQHDLCLDKLGYGFIRYAPAMAYLFAYKGYTYERFKYLHLDNIKRDRHILEPINNNSNKVYQSFLFIMQNKDAREYLIALHYNRELRYYAEHPTEGIDADSILNEFITRNIAVLIRKMWTDTNKFIIACNHLLQRKDLSNCAQSMLIYCLAHLQMYEPIRNRLQERMYQKGKETLKQQGLWDATAEQEKFSNGSPAEDSLWKIDGATDAEKLERFKQLSLKHSMRLFNQAGRWDLQKWKEEYKRGKDFWSYNRQHQMLYYGDLSIKNDANIHALIPGSDLVYMGFDFHDCFNYLHVKLMSSHTYPLCTYDLFTVCDLLISRLKCEHLAKNVEKENTFFYRDKDAERANAVRSQVDKILEIFSEIKDSDQQMVYKDVCQFFRDAISSATL